MSKESVKGLQTVHRAIRLLNCFTIEEPELSLTELMRKSDLPKSTTARLIETLVNTGMVERNEYNFNYKLGHNVYILGQVAEQGTDIIQVATPIMKKLQEDTQESITLYKIEQNKRVCIKRFVSPQLVTHNVSVGTRLDLMIGATGKALLAFQEPTFIDQIVAGTGNKEKLLKDLENIRKTNQSISFDERNIGVNAISSAVFNMSGEVRYSLGVSGPSNRFVKEVIESWQERLWQDAKQLSEEIGFRK